MGILQDDELVRAYMSISKCLFKKQFVFSDFHYAFLIVSFDAFVSRFQFILCILDF